MIFASREEIMEMTSLWKGERFEDGRPRVPDSYLDALSKMTLEELWKPIFVKGYESQFEGDLKTLHPEFSDSGAVSHKLIGRALTATYAPRRPDLFARFDESQLTTKADRKILQQARAEFAEEPGIR